MTRPLDLLAEAHGIAVAYEGLDGVIHVVPDETKRSILAAMSVAVMDDDAVAESLRHAPLAMEQGLDEAESTRCYMSASLGEGGNWGIAIQLYGLRSGRNWGIGDFADLARFAAVAAEAGADFVGINPVHAGFLAEPERRSPFFPSSRRFLNPLYIAVDRVPGFSPDMADEALIASARAPELVDYPLVTRLKLAVLRQVWTAWRDHPGLPQEYRHSEFQAFLDEAGEPLTRHALFDALSFELQAERPGGWDVWPEAFRSPDGPEVAAFIESRGEEIAFFAWLQWLASVQLEAAQEAARAAGMNVGLYLDFAVGEAPDGSATWGQRHLTLPGLHIGAPPDYFSTAGQDWALAPLSSAALRGADITRYRAMIGNSMRYGGALRLDHVMQVRQLFLIPKGRPPAEGTYVHFPTSRMLAAIAAASHEHETVVIGEDLGNVPRGLRDEMAAARILSYRILYFEQDGGRFIGAGDYPREAMACLSTHDLPTLEGWWRGQDIDLRRDHNLIEPGAARVQMETRTGERRALCDALVREGLLPSGNEGWPNGDMGMPEEKPLPLELVVAVHRFIARAPSRMVAVRVEDLCGERRPSNLPGTVDAYPNWQRKLPLDLEALPAQPLFRAVTAALAAERPRQ